MATLALRAAALRRRRSAPSDGAKPPAALVDRVKFLLKEHGQPLGPLFRALKGGPWWAQDGLRALAEDLRRRDRQP